MQTQPKPALKIFTWHIHGSYLYYLSQGAYEIYIPVNEHRTEGYYGRGATFPFGSNVHEVPAAAVKDMQFDCILFQSERNYLQDQHELLTAEQRSLPRIYLEHNTPTGSACNTRHVVNDPHVLVVHVTAYNRLMWDNGNVPTTVIEHGVTDPGIAYSGGLARGLVVVNHLPDRGRTLGWDIYREVSRFIPLDLAGMGNAGHGLGEVLHPQLPEVRSRYRFYFHPVRHTSLGLAVCEAMMQGVPVVGLATTELPNVIVNGENGYIHTDIDYLIKKMQGLLDNHGLANCIGRAGQETAQQRFGIRRFTTDWLHLFHKVIARQQQGSLNAYQQTMATV